MARHGGFSIALTRNASAGHYDGYYQYLMKTAGSELLAKLPGLEQHPQLASIPAIPPATLPQKPAAIAGFRHFLCDTDTLPLHKQFKVDGEDPLRSKDSVERLQKLMALLATRMSKAQVWEGDEGNPNKGENPDIPAGYTYLLQLVAHDLVQTSLPVSILEDTTTGVRNDRGYRLKLDTIYGAGPEVCPFAYVTGPEPHCTRSRLRLGELVNGEDKVEMTPKGRDIARFDAGEGRKTSKRPRLTDVLIADPRNDDHAILSQLTTLFHHLHNGLMNKLPQPSQLDTADSASEATFDAFLCTRGAAALIYRNIIRRDLMKRVLNREIYNRYNVDQPKFLSDYCAERYDERNEAGAVSRSWHRGSFIPLEFTHGAFRFGHAMARDKYMINHMKDPFPLGDVVRATSFHEPTSMPLGRKWIIRWSNFFDVPNEEGRRPQPSMRISPHFSSELEDPYLFPAIEKATAQCGLAYRDLMSAAFVRLWSVNSLIDEIRSRRPALIRNCRLLNDRWYRVECLRTWLEKDRGGMTEADIHTLANDPPLPFFILFEAAMGPDDPTKRGKTLGVLGSIIVAEVIFGAMLEDRLPGVGASGGLRQSLARFCSRVYSTNHLEFVPEIETMGQLVAFIVRTAELEDADPKFF
ncbi:MAG TPA: peroxidase family protein [Bradyrhizobium sp.]|nr:peroxidase family protein [Bradyrhizobium sp.]